MNFKKLLVKAYDYATSNDFQNVEQLSRKILKKKPENFDALLLLGTALSEQGDPRQGAKILEKALKKNCRNSSVKNNLGHAYIKIGEFENALSVLKDAAQLDPNDPEIHINIGNAYLNLHNMQKAESSYRQALDLNPSVVLAVNNLGICLLEQGKLKEALQMFIQANQLDPTQSSTYVQLFDTLLLLHATNDLEQVIIEALQLETISELDKYRLHTAKAVISYLVGNIDRAEQTIEHIKSYFNKNNLNAIDVDSRKAIDLYRSFLGKLLKERSVHAHLYEGTPETPLFFVAESHCLSPSEQVVTIEDAEYRVLSMLIMGCKAFHLASSQDNKYKASIEILFAALPARSKIVIGFGEIDCRFDEGIFPAHKAGKINFKKAIPEMIDRYVSFLTKSAQPYEHEILIYGVPAPTEKALSIALNKDDRELLKEIIIYFNSSLITKAASESLPVFDTYSASLYEKGIGNSDFYIDNSHLHPKTIPLIFNFHLIS